MAEQKTHNSLQNTQEQTYSPHDLATAISLARKYAEAAELLRDFYKQRAIAMCTAFGVKSAIRHIDPGFRMSVLRDIPGLSDDDVTLIRVLGRFIDSVNSVKSPFSGFLAAPKIINDLCRRHSKHINEAVRLLSAANFNLLTDALCKAYHIDPKHTVTDDDLRDNGFDPDQPWPDPDDYL